MKRFCFFILPVSVLIICMASSQRGTLWNKKLQQITGRVKCEFYDLSGEGVGYHDTKKK